MWGDVVICGSLSSSNDDIKKIKDYLLNKNVNRNIFYNPIVPFKGNTISFKEIVRNWYDLIDRSCVVIGVTKPDGSFGEGTTYELEYARKMNKNIIVYDVKGKKIYPYNDMTYIIYNDIFSKLREFGYLQRLEVLEDRKVLEDSEDRKDGDLVDS